MARYYRKRGNLPLICMGNLRCGRYEMGLERRGHDIVEGLWNDE
jgi:hypothetical protein